MPPILKNSSYSIAVVNLPLNRKLQKYVAVAVHKCTEV